MRLRHLQDFPNAPEPDADWPRFYADYPPKEFPARRFSDGGILDNKPFSYATGSLVGRRAPLPVDRKLVFVEPDPSTGAGEPPAGDWNGLQTAQAAVLTLPRAEDIRGDLQAVLTRNRAIERVRDILAQASTDAPERDRIQKMLATDEDSEDWPELSLVQTIERRDWGPSYASYHRLKVRGLVDYLALLVVRGQGPRSRLGRRSSPFTTSSARGRTRATPSTPDGRAGEREPGAPRLQPAVPAGAA